MPTVAVSSANVIAGDINKKNILATQSARKDIAFEFGVFTITSYIENSPNSLAEAMLSGLPCVASYVGGIPSMVDGGLTGLLYPVEEVPVLADRIRRIFLDDQLAMQLGENARRIALERHDPAAVVDQLLAAYNKICALHP